MGIQVWGLDGTVQEVDQPFNAARVAIWPGPEIACVSLGVQTGVLPTATPAGALLFSLRNAGSNLLLVRRVTVGFAIATNFTTSQRIELALTLARGWTAFESGGNLVSFAGNRHRQATPPLNAEARVATTAGLTAGTGRAVDAQYFGLAHGGASAAVTTMPATPLVSLDAGDYPLVLANNEGFVVTNGFLFGAGGSGVVYINLEIAEISLAEWEGGS